MRQAVGSQVGTEIVFVVRESTIDKKFCLPDCRQVLQDAEVSLVANEFQCLELRAVGQIVEEGVWVFGPKIVQLQFLERSLPRLDESSVVGRRKLKSGCQLLKMFAGKPNWKEIWNNWIVTGISFLAQIQVLQIFGCAEWQNGCLQVSLFGIRLVTSGCVNRNSELDERLEQSRPAEIDKAHHGEGHALVDDVDDSDLGVAGNSQEQLIAEFDFSIDVPLHLDLSSFHLDASEGRESDVKLFNVGRFLEELDGFHRLDVAMEADDKVSIPVVGKAEKPFTDGGNVPEQIDCREVGEDPYQDFFRKIFKTFFGRSPPFEWRSGRDTVVAGIFETRTDRMSFGFASGFAGTSQAARDRLNFWFFVVVVSIWNSGDGKVSGSRDEVFHLVRLQTDFSPVHELENAGHLLHRFVGLMNFVGWRFIRRRFIGRRFFRRRFVERLFVDRQFVRRLFVERLFVERRFEQILEAWRTNRQNELMRSENKTKDFLKWKWAEHSGKTIFGWHNLLWLQLVMLLIVISVNVAIVNLSYLFIVLDQICKDILM
jgi:hypothetical protein